MASHFPLARKFFGADVPKGLESQLPEFEATLIEHTKLKAMYNADHNDYEAMMFQLTFLKSTKNRMGTQPLGMAEIDTCLLRTLQIKNLVKGMNLNQMIQSMIDDDRKRIVDQIQAVQANFEIKRQNHMNMQEGSSEADLAKTLALEIDESKKRTAIIKEKTATMSALIAKIFNVDRQRMFHMILEVAITHKEVTSILDVSEKAA
ncbi:hypothetical protein KR018_001279 [Drosophila ironensis]|nr:hypothetical protein KR018_001279 [Drosophila ironensis]